MDECITKHRAKHFVCEFCNEHFSDEPCEPSDCEWMNSIDKEPAIDPESLRPQGEWVDAEDGDGIVCPACGVDFCVLTNETERFNYCPNCGAKMKGETECSS